MTAATHQVRTATPPHVGTRTPTATVLRGIPWVIAVGAIVWALRWTGTPMADVLRFTLYLAFGLAAPGTLLLRVLVKRRRPLVEELLLGTVLAFAFELGTLVLLSAVGLQAWLRCWAILVMVVFAVVPGLRHHWSPSESAPGLPAWWHWGVATAASITAVGMLRAEGAYHLPPRDGTYYQDLLWHLGIVHSLTRSVPPEIPQVSGETLRYHWFSHAQMASAHLVSGVPEASVVLRLWPALMVVLALVAAAVLARELSGIWWSGPLAATSVGMLRGIQLLPVGSSPAAVNGLSPSQAYVTPLALTCAVLVIGALRGERLGRGWIAVVLVAVVASGSKPTALPMLAAGAVMATIASVIMRRASWRSGVGLLGVVAVIFPVSSKLLSGSDAGTTIRLFDYVEWLPLYHLLTGQGFHPVSGPTLPEGVADLGQRSVVILALLLAVVIVPQAALIGAAVSLRHRAVRRDPAAWFMIGVVGSGVGVYFLLSHPALSQAYFMHLAVGFAGPLLAWVVVGSVERVALKPVQTVGLVLAGLGLGAGVVGAARRLTPTPSGVQVRSLGPWERAFGVPMGIALGVLVIGALVAYLAQKLTRVPRGSAVAVLAVAAVLGAPLATAARPSLVPVGAMVLHHPVPNAGGLPLPRGAGAALDWLNRTAADDDVVATNRHCSTGREVAGCRALAFYVSGLGGREVVLEGWGYTSTTGGLQVASPWPVRQAENDALFSHPTAEGFALLKERYAIKWLVADSSAAPVSPQITTFATERFRSGTVTIYQVKP